MIDIENLKQFLGSDEEFIAVLMDKFLQEIPKDASNLKSAAESSDWPKVRAVSHKMLSSTKIFAFEELTSILQKVEKYSESKTNLDQIPGLIKAFAKSCDKALKELEDYRAAIKSK